MKITEVYKKYRINKGLQEHMIRVGAVAKLICERATVDLPTRHIVDGCLVHDLGNLIKAKLDSFPELFEPEGVDYWRQVKAEMTAQYGENVHEATDAMVKEMGLNDDSYQYFLAIGGEATERVHGSLHLGEKIANYSDMRVGVFNIISLTERMDDLRARYLARNLPGFGSDEIDVRQSFLEDMEADIFAHSTIKPEDITDESTAAIQSELWDWGLATRE
jgi:hypothetical protein